MFNGQFIHKHSPHVHYSIWWNIYVIPTWSLQHWNIYWHITHHIKKPSSHGLRCPLKWSQICPSTKSKSCLEMIQDTPAISHKNFVPNVNVLDFVGAIFGGILLHQDTSSIAATVTKKVALRAKSDKSQGIFQVQVIHKALPRFWEIPDGDSWWLSASRVPIPVPRCS